MSVTTHAAQMDGMYRRQKHIYDLTRKYYLLGRDHMIRHLEVPIGGHVLELGCGTGRNLLLANRHYPEAHFHGLDISREMLDTAKKLAERAQLDLTLAVGDASSFDAALLFPQIRFDRIFISYALSMIPAWEATITNALSMLNHGGSLHIVDFGQQERLPAWFKAGLFAWLERFQVYPRQQLFDHMRSQAATQIKVESLFRGYAWHTMVKTT
ncbi:MAG: class I SAM-dependent methyltransferase [Rhizobiaceae bacterium]|nr:class I SAM-dependent methyltransferase [Rhizobiaceae bacterium]